MADETEVEFTIVLEELCDRLAQPVGQSGCGKNVGMLFGPR